MKVTSEWAKVLTIFILLVTDMSLGDHLFVGLSRKFLRISCLKRRQAHLLFEDLKLRLFCVSLSQAITFQMLIRLVSDLRIFRIGKAS